MSLFLSLGFFLFSLYFSLSIFSWRKNKISKYFLYIILGIFGFILSWISTYLAKASYGMLLSEKLFPPFTLMDELFYNWLIFLFPLLLIGFIIFSFNYKPLKEEFPQEGIYFWWTGFFLGFSLYYLLQETNKYSQFEYILLPLILISLFLTLVCFFDNFKDSSFFYKLIILVTLSFIYSLPQSFYSSLYIKSLWISIFSCLFLGIISFYFIKKSSKNTNIKE